MSWFVGLRQFIAIFGLSRGPSSRICSPKPTYENEHNAHGHFLIFNVYGLFFPHNARSFCVHFKTSLFWGCFRNHMSCGSFLEQNAEKYGWRCGWLFWRSMVKQIKNCKTVILRINFRWLYINVETQNYVKIQKNLDRSCFVLT